MSGNPIIGEKVLYSNAFKDQPDYPARMGVVWNEQRGRSQIELLGGARDGEKINCGYDMTGEFACCWHREGDLKP